MSNADRDKAASLIAQEKAIDTQISQLRRHQRELQEQANTYLLKERPTYPTQQQRDGIKLAAVKVLAGEPASSHHGDAVAEGNNWVTVDGRPGVGRLSIQHGAPYDARHTGGKLWHFTDEEITELIALVEAEGLTVTDHWQHDNGVSIKAVKA